MELDDYTQLENRYKELRTFAEVLAGGHYGHCSGNYIAELADIILVKIGEWAPKEETK